MHRCGIGVKLPKSALHSLHDCMSTGMRSCTLLASPLAKCTTSSTVATATHPAANGSSLYMCLLTDPSCFKRT